MELNTAGLITVIVILTLLTRNAIADRNQANFEKGDEHKGGVFLLKDMRVPAIPEEVKESNEPMIRDDDGNTNELIIMPNYSHDLSHLFFDQNTFDNKITKWPEDIILDGVNEKQSPIMTAFGQPKNGAVHLINKGRLTDNERLTLNDSDPIDRLHRYIVLRYENIEAAKLAESVLAKQPWIEYVSINKELDFSFAPNDPYFAINPLPARYQWGVLSMNYPTAWNKTKGHGYIGIIDSIASISHSDIATVRPQLSFSISNPGNQYKYHGQHVTGIIAGTQNNNIGVAGGCANCSIALAQARPLTSGVSESLYGLVNRGVQVINMSFGRNNVACNSYQPICEALAYASQRDVLTVAAAGNYKNSNPDFPANQPTVLAVGGIQIDQGYVPSIWTMWSHDNYNGSSWPGTQGVVAPAKSIVSTVTPGLVYYNGPEAKCSDSIGYDQYGYYGEDESGIYNDGYGSCTGTSMATPYVSALAGILRSINPRSSYQSINDHIRMSGDKAASPTSQYGYGLPRANIAVDLTINDNIKRLTPLFSYYSSGRKDYFYTTVPQLAAAAYSGSLYPVNTPNTTSSMYAGVGTAISGYASYPGSPPYNIPLAQSWVFTTPENPYSVNISLAPLYRMSWKCGDEGWVAICNTNPNHTDFTYTTETSGISAFQSVGYKLDGVEGYIYPKNISQPPNTVRLMRKYNPINDDHAIFPEPLLANMLAQGYVEDSGSNWLGYVYENTNGKMPNY